MTIGIISVCVCVLSSHLFWTTGLWTYQPGSHRRKITQEENHTGCLHLPSAVLALIFLREEFSCPFPSSTVKSNLVY